MSWLGGVSRGVFPDDRDAMLVGGGLVVGDFRRARPGGITGAVASDQSGRGLLRLGPDAKPLIIGAHVSCTDGDCGRLARVIVNPVTRTVTHLVVEPRHHRGLGRLVPVDLIDVVDKKIQLRCSVAEFQRLDEAEDLQFLPYTDAESGYAAGDALALPYYGLHFDAEPIGVAGFGSLDAPRVPEPVATDRIPAGELEISRGDHVHASDGEIGVVEGLVIDPRDEHVTHLLLQEGHLWGRKQVAIPISSVRSENELIKVDLTKQQIQDLPPVRLRGST